MIIIPAIDIMDGKCVRMYQGRFEAVKVYSNDPTEMAQKWKNEGAEFIHIVDLNGAVSGEPENLDAIEKIIKEVDVDVQVGGGIRYMTALETLMNLGVSRVILGTVVVTAPEFVAEACQKYDDKIAAGVDARGGKVAIEGWKKGTEFEATEIGQELKLLGIPRVIYTDILADGTRRGVNLPGVKKFAEMLDIPIIVSGGVGSLEDIKALKELKPMGVEGVIVGTALYEQTFSLPEAIEAGRWK